MRAIAIAIRIAIRIAIAMLSPHERATRRMFLRVARVLIGLVLIVVLSGGAQWLRASIYPWTDRDVAGVRLPHAVLHLRNESGSPLALAWRIAATPGRGPAPWLDLPPVSELPAGVVEQRGFRVLAPVSRAAGVGASPASPQASGALSVELRLTLGGEKFVLPLALTEGEHASLRIAADRTPFLATGDANWVGAPRFGDEHPAPLVP